MKSYVIVARCPAPGKEVGATLVASLAENSGEGGGAGCVRREHGKMDVHLDLVGMCACMHLWGAGGGGVV